MNVGLSLKKYSAKTQRGVYVYLCDMQEYLDELRENRESENFRQILEERALYGKEIDFTL